MMKPTIILCFHILCTYNFSDTNIIVYLTDSSTYVSLVTWIWEVLGAYGLQNYFLNCLYCCHLMSYNFILVSSSQFTFDISSFCSIFSDLKASLSASDSLAFLFSILLSFTSNLKSSPRTVYLASHHYLWVFHELILQYYLNILLSYYLTIL